MSQFVPLHNILVKEKRPDFGKHAVLIFAFWTICSSWVIRSLISTAHGLTVPLPCVVMSPCSEVASPQVGWSMDTQQRPLWVDLCRSFVPSVLCSNTGSAECGAVQRGAALGRFCEPLAQLGPQGEQRRRKGLQSKADKVSWGHQHSWIQGGTQEGASGTGKVLLSWVSLHDNQWPAPLGTRAVGWYLRYMNSTVWGRDN